MFTVIAERHIDQSPYGTTQEYKYNTRAAAIKKHNAIINTWLASGFNATDHWQMGTNTLASEYKIDTCNEYGQRTQERATILFITPA